jgi:hypothetical protein
MELGIRNINIKFTEVRKAFKDVCYMIIGITKRVAGVESQRERPKIQARMFINQVRKFL